MYNYSVIRIFWLKHKKAILIAFAVLFLVALFLIKNTSIFKNQETYQTNLQTAGLAYDATIGDLITQDADKDGVPDWEESLYGLDPTKKETNPGIPDSTAINKLKTKEGGDTGVAIDNNVENLTETDKFGRELFSTTTSLTQNGLIDQASADQIGASLADKIKNSVPRKIFSFLDIKLDSSQIAKTYNDNLTNVFEKNKMPDYTAVDVLQKFIADGNNVDADALIKLDPIIKSTKGIIDGLTKMSVPESFVSAHLDFLNGWERIMENLSDIRLYDTDPVVALAGIDKYGDNSILLISANENLSETISKK